MLWYLVLMWIVLAGVGLAAYLIPSMVAFKIRHPWRWWILAINAFSGWTVLGWFGLLILIPVSGGVLERRKLEGRSSALAPSISGSTGKCSNCKDAYLSGEDVCPSCGRLLEKSVAADNRAIILLVGVLVLIAVIVVYITLDNGGTSKQIQMRQVLNDPKPTQQMGDGVQAGIGVDTPKQSDKPCDVPSIHFKSQFDVPPPPTGENMAATLEAIRQNPTLDAATIEEMKKEAMKKDADNSARGHQTTNDIDTFDPDTEIGHRMNGLLVDMDNALSNFLAHNDIALNEYKGASYASSDGNVETAQKEYQAGVTMGEAADKNKEALRELASNFAASWQQLDYCYKIQFANETIWPNEAVKTEPDIFVVINADGSLNYVGAHDSKSSAFRVKLYPSNW
ncbi:superinfection immunity protein [Telmatobacter sp. DSM 110680]|uniref:Superinfection immunity protein n=1 Tax=Telmatobacter sp. DSM 110680 TaxID=3036704 RepID=A0AAU7DQZ3_9BACT